MKSGKELLESALKAAEDAAQRKCETLLLDLDLKRMAYFSALKEIQNLGRSTSSSQNQLFENDCHDEDIECAFHTLLAKTTVDLNDGVSGKPSTDSLLPLPELELVNLKVVHNGGPYSYLGYVFSGRLKNNTTVPLYEVTVAVVPDFKSAGYQYDDSLVSAVTTYIPRIESTLEIDITISLQSQLRRPYYSRVVLVAFYKIKTKQTAFQCCSVVLGSCDLTKNNKFKTDIDDLDHSDTVIDVEKSPFLRPADFVACWYPFQISLWVTLKKQPLLDYAAFLKPFETAGLEFAVMQSNPGHQIDRLVATSVTQPLSLIFEKNTGVADTGHGDSNVLYNLQVQADSDARILEYMDALGASITMCLHASTPGAIQSISVDSMRANSGERRLWKLRTLYGGSLIQVLRDFKSTHHLASSSAAKLELMAKVGDILAHAWQC